MDDDLYRTRILYAPGFSFLEIGLTRQKNTVNILFKNFFVITVGFFSTA